MAAPVHPAVFTRVSALRGQIAPITAITLFGVSLSMSYPLFALTLERAGASGTAIGLNAMAAAVGMIACAPVVPGLLRRMGMGLLMVLGALALAGMFLMIPLAGSFWLLTGLRLLYGFAGTVLFFASEYWIVAVAPDHSRGRIVAVYALCVSGGFALGPALLTLTGLTGFLPYGVAAAVMLAGLVPILWGRHSAPRADDEMPAPMATLRVFLTDPAVVFGVVLFGSIEFGVMALVTVWGVRSGLGEADAALLLSVFAVGAMVLQLPLGWAADRFDRRALLAAIAACSVVAPLGMALAAPSFPALAALALFWGATSVGLYSVALTEIGARYRGNNLAVANAAVVLGYGLGAFAAPVAFGAAMDLIPPDGLMLSAAAVALLYLALALIRTTARRHRVESQRKPLDRTPRTSR